jgi:hypothetical protein
LVRSLPNPNLGSNTLTLLSSFAVLLLLYTIKDSNEKLKLYWIKVSLYIFNLIRKSCTNTQVPCIYYLFITPCSARCCPTSDQLQILGPPLPRSTLFTKCSSQHAIHMTYQFDYLPVPVPGCLFLFGSSLPLPLLLLPDLLSPSSVACA